MTRNFPRRADPSLRAARLKVALPLAAALVLLATSVILLLTAGGEETSRDDEAGAIVESATPAATEMALPIDDPSDPDPFLPNAPPERYGGKYPRWNLPEFPAGWDDTTASTIHDFFEDMEWDMSDERKMLRLEEIRAAFREYLATVGPEAIPTLAAILNVEPDFVDRRFLIHAIGELGPQSEEATYALSDYVENRFQDPRARSELGHVIMAMGKLHNASSFDTLEEFSRREDLHPYRGKFIQALGEHPDREAAIGTFVSTMRNDTLPDVRNYAAQALGKVREPQSLPGLYEAFEREPHWVPRQTILGTIGKIGDARSIPFLEEQARNAPESAIRLSAAGALRRMESPYARRLLGELARSEPDEKVRAHIEKWAKLEEAVRD